MKIAKKNEKKCKKIAKKNLYFLSEVENAALGFLIEEIESDAVLPLADALQQLRLSGRVDDGGQRRLCGAAPVDQQPVVVDGREGQRRRVAVR